MSDVSRLLSWFDEGLLVRPNLTTPSTVHLAHVLAAYAGVEGDLDAPEREIATAIGDAEHVVFVLADGLGMNLVESRDERSVLRRGLKMELTTVFPSSTAPALTSLATGLWPSQHGLPSWHVYLAEEQRQVTALPFIERFTERPAGEVGIKSKGLFPAPVTAPTYRHDARAFLPRRIADSVYSRYTRGGLPATPYDKLNAGMDMIAARVATSKAPTYTYLYYPGIDTAEHKHGPESRQARVEIERMEMALERLVHRLDGAARVVVSADHGQFLVQRRQKHFVRPDDELLSLLVTPPSGEPRTPIFQCKPGKATEFAKRFRGCFGEHFALLTPDEIESMQLMGPGELSSATRQRLGDFMSLSPRGEVLVYEPDAEVVKMRGFHGGLSRDEVRIPLIVVE